MDNTAPAQPASKGPAPLAGIRVLDLARVFAGPVAGRIMADLGAEVVKVEPPEGDVTRLWGRKIGGLSTYFTQQNLGKRGICIDLRVDGGPELVLDLAEQADIVIENFRPGIMARYGIDYAALSARKPDLIMLSISGFGQVGPESQRAAYASVVHAETGLVEYTRVEDAQDVSFGAGDVVSGMHGVIGVLAALRVREQTGIGQHIDMAMMDAMAFSMDTIQNSLDNRFNEKQAGEIWQTASGPMSLPGGLRWIWHQLSNTFGLTDPTPKDADLATKRASRYKIATDFLCGLPDRDAVIAALDRAGLAWGEVKELDQVLASPTFQHRGSILQVDDRAGGTRPIVRSPLHMSASKIREDGVAPRRGEENEAVLSEWLGLGPTAISALADAQVVLAEPNDD